MQPTDHGSVWATMEARYAKNAERLIVKNIVTVASTKDLSITEDTLPSTETNFFHILEITIVRIKRNASLILTETETRYQIGENVLLSC